MGAGVFYGFYHQASLSASAKLAAMDRDYRHKQSLIDQAKAEYTRKNSPGSGKPSGGGTFSQLNVHPRICESAEMARPFELDIPAHS